MQIWKEPGGELRRIGRCVGVTVVGQRFDPQRGERAVLLRRQLGRDVVVTGERVGLKILHTILNPLDRFSRQHRGRHGNDVAWVDWHLAAETAAEVGRDDADLVFGQSYVTGDECEHGAYRVRRLGGHPHRQLA